MNLKLINIALTQYGIKEITGNQDNPEVLKYFNETGFDGAKLKDETSWCSAFVNWAALKAGAKTSGKLTARSWLTVGADTKSPEMGDVAVLWRESKASWKGHVGIFIREAGDFVYLLGGNQNNQVCISAYNKSQLLGYRRI